MPHLINMIKQTNLPLLNDLFVNGNINKNKKSKNKTLGKQFISDLSKLIKAINSTKPIYIRCIKPNNKKQKHFWNAKKVLNQIKSGGLFSAIGIRQKGFSYRQNFNEFVKRYKWCVNNKQIRNTFENNCNDFKQICEIIIGELSNKLNEKDIQIG